MLSRILTTWTLSEQYVCKEGKVLETLRNSRLLTSVKFLPVRVDIFHVENIFEEHTCHFGSFTSSDFEETEEDFQLNTLSNFLQEEYLR